MNGEVGKKWKVHQSINYIAVFDGFYFELKAK